MIQFQQIQKTMKQVAAEINSYINVTNMLYEIFLTLSSRNKRVCHVKPVLEEHYLGVM